ncbi:MAG: ParM/StbA family protein [Nevskia sp.]|jgi:plasmid segregation protein ParM|nr:ParM/StbA family protein [Nevskia sp.]MCK9384325.1 ParM/StbA family protein [Nevskia sp.]
MRILAADIGFGYTKACDGKQMQVFKSIVGEANPVQFAEALLPGQGPLPRHFQIGDEAIYVGELAETQSRGRGFTLDPALFIAKYAKTLGLAALAPYAEHGDPVRLVTGLPVSFFRKYKDALTTTLQNRHVITVFNPNGEREEKTIYIEKVRVIPQPFGSLFNLMLNDQGKLAQQRFISEKIGVIDVGFRTTDFTVADKTRYSERGSLSTDSGISVAYNAIAGVLQEKSGTQIELYRLYEAVARGTIKIKGQRFDLTGLVQQAFSQLASRIAAEANRLWADDWDIDCIILTGGGGAALAQHLQPLVQGEVLAMPADQDARFNNVVGYWKYGMNLWGG